MYLRLTAAEKDLFVVVDGEKLTVNFDLIRNKAKIEFTKKDDKSFTGKLMDSPTKGIKKETRHDFRQLLPLLR